MEVHNSVESLRAALAAERRAGKSVGFVPTMGALHAGHISLVERSVSSTDVTVLSIFVNPLQFGKNEDLSRYPRPLEADLKLAEAAGVSHVFAPSVGEMYPGGEPLTSVHVARVTEPMEGALRPGHFDGVSTVVTKLFSIVGECTAFFGEKDWQQLAVVRTMSTDLSLPVTVVGCPIVREPDGLALSSRNVYLDEAQRRAALSLSAALRRGVDLVKSGVRDPRKVSSAVFEVMADEPGVDPQYAEVVDELLQTPEVIDTNCRVLVAAKVGTTRLIDNMGVDL